MICEDLGYMILYNRSGKTKGMLYHSVKNIGEAITGYRPQLVLSTKGGGKLNDFRQGFSRAILFNEIKEDSVCAVSLICCIKSCIPDPHKSCFYMIFKD